MRTVSKPRVRRRAVGFRLWALACARTSDQSAGPESGPAAPVQGDLRRQVSGRNGKGRWGSSWVALSLAGLISLPGLIGLPGGPAATVLAADPAPLRDEVVVERYRQRITKVRNAIVETRGVIAASRGAPFLPELYLRLAELLSEEARYHYLVAFEREGRSTQLLHVPQVRALKEEAISTYQLILDTWPTSSLVDRIRFNIAQEQRELGMFEDMRKTLEKLVKDLPNSPFRPEALLVLGDYAFDKADLNKAKGYYQDLVKLKPGPLSGLAHYKLAWVYVNQADCKLALGHFEQAIRVARAVAVESASTQASELELSLAPDEGQRLKASQRSLNVQREALVDLSYCYSQQRPPEKAVEYLHELAADRETYLAALSRLASRYVTIEQPKGAAEMLREILRLAPDDAARLDDARLLHQVVTRMGDYAQVGEDVGLILKALRRQLLRPGLSPADATQLEGEFETLARDLATRAHRALTQPQVAKGKAWTTVPATPAETARAYLTYLDTLPASAYRLDMVQNLADVLATDKQLLEAGHRYREAAELLASAAAKARLTDGKGALGSSQALRGLSDLSKASSAGTAGSAEGATSLASSAAPGAEAAASKAESGTEKTAGKATEKTASASGKGTEKDGKASEKTASASGKGTEKDGKASEKTASSVAARVAGTDGAAQPPEDKKESEIADVPSETLRTAAELEVDRQEALFNAVVSYQKVLTSTTARDHGQRALAGAGLRAAGGAWLMSEAASGSGADREKVARIKFAVGQSFYDEGRYLPAIDLLTAVALEYPRTSQGDAAVHLVLDSYENLSDLDGLLHAGNQFMAANSPVSKEIQAQIKPILETAEQRRFDALSLAAAGEQEGGMETLLAFADRFQGTALGERALLNTFVAARAAGQTAEVYTLGEKLLSGFPTSEHVPGVLGTLGRTATARFELDRAVGYLEQAASVDQTQRVALLVAAGELREQLGDASGALVNYADALKADGAKKGSALAHFATLLEQTASPAEVVSQLQPLVSSGDPAVTSRLGLALLRLGKTDEAESLFRGVLQGAASATPDAMARAHYGLAEQLLGSLERFTPAPEVEALEEVVGLVEVVLQSYLAAARQPDPVFSQAAFARLARGAELGAQKLEAFKLPSGLSAEEQAQVQDALARRVIQLRDGGREALTECANRARRGGLMDEASLACLKGEAPAADPARTRPVLAPRGKPETPADVESLRVRLVRNPSDLEALQALGQAYLRVGDAHTARLVLGRTVEAGGGAEALNRLGLTAWKAGDTWGAMDAFARARAAGSPAGSHNLAAVYRRLGLAEVAGKLLEGVPPVSGEALLEGGSAAPAVGGAR